ncbi:hypothetical protein B0H66DRAFT_546420 [Apodospora peruviana]|uniref:T6SS Phospholipase effector Tle1-like catalytic domain-containing protein n=1 Tax=Apodospora peruviana TaxID=516989 RepID=A0AAE0IUG9_9PEZI|nr:hypothetical protein B0H66DRAFT_546420 [Apodospora peruviana]
MEKSLLIDQDQSICGDCGMRHVPRRLICAVDGTWMVPDGVAGQETGNASNIARIYLCTREGLVEDDDGKKWQQIRKYWPGVGSASWFPNQLISGAFGRGVDALIGEVYKYCAQNCCPSRDEIFLFGFSRGAVLVRAVASLFNYLHTLKPELPDFDEHFQAAQKLYKKLTDKNDVLRHQHEKYLHLAQNTRPAPNIKFMGLFDSVMGTADWMFNNKYDLGHVECVRHIRHALALLEKRWLYQPTRFLGEAGPPRDEMFSESTWSPKGHSSVETWFFGRHGNMGGSGDNDGLALWPLQWILGEAQQFGLVLDDPATSEISKHLVVHPLHYIRPQEGLSADIRMKNGYTFTLWGLGKSFVTPGFDDTADDMNFFTAGPPGTYRTRNIFGGDGRLIGYSDADPYRSAFIHPSVALHYDSSPDAVRHLNKLECIDDIRNFAKSIQLPSLGSLYSTEVEGPESRVRHLDRRYFRTLVCGSCGAGKSTLINKMAREELATVSHGARPVEHLIEMELVPTREGTEQDPQFIFHDSAGFEHSSEEQLRTMDGFVENRRGQDSFPEQIHCIWYCIPANATRLIQDSDLNLFRSLRRKSGLSVLLVLTQCDKLKMQCIETVKREMAEVADPFDNVADSLKDQVITAARALYEKKKEEMQDLARRPEHFGEGVRCIFVAASYGEGLEELKAATRAAMNSEELLKIYNVAVKAKLDSIMPVAANEALRWVRRSRESESIQRHLLPSKELQDNFYNELQTRLVSRDIFNMVLPKVPVTDAQPVALFGPQRKPHPVADVLAVKASMVMATFNGVVAPIFTYGAGVQPGGLGGPWGAMLGALAVAASAAAYHIDRSVSYQNHIQKLVSAASAVLLLERVYWYGGRTPSLSMLTRAAVRGIHLMPHLVAFFQNAFHNTGKLFGTEHESRIFREAIERSRFDFARELEGGSGERGG